MKKIVYNILLAGLAGSLTAKAQTNDTPMLPAETNAPAIVELIASNAPVVAVTDAMPTNAPAAALPVVGEEIPHIQFSDAPLTTVIENLARRAGINYMLDPKIGYGLPDANGQVKVEPTLSIRWDNISAENALIALLDNYGLQLVRDKKTSIDRISLKDPLAPPPLITRVVQLKYSSVANMTEAAQSVLTDKRSRVLPDVRTSQLIVVATDAEQQSVDTLMARLDQPTRQVLIETRLVEISSNPKTKKGIDWSGTLSGQNVSFGNGNLSGQIRADGGNVSTTSSTTTGTTPGGGFSTGTTTATGNGQLGNLVTTIVGSGGQGGFNWNTASGLMPAIGFLNADGLHAVISFINSSADAQIVSTPRIVTLDNETANIEVTRGYPVFNVSAGSANNAGGSSVAYTNVGTKLKVTPRISANDNIWLKVSPEVSSFFGNFSQSVGGGNSSSGSQILTAPVFDVRTITTQVIIPNGNTLVMGGLVKDNPQSSTTKVPLLGDIPWLGHAFRSEDKSLDKENLLIFITPTIIQDSDFQVHPSTFLKTSPYAPRPQLINPKSLWDSSDPHDWSDPAKKMQKPALE